MKRFTWLALWAVVVAGCAAPGPVATVNGAEIPASDLASLHPPSDDPDGEERASSLLLLILHRLLVPAARAEFGVEVTQEAQRMAFDARTEGFGSRVDQELHERGVTRDRVLLEADLDVVRGRVERQLVSASDGGADLDLAYRTFLMSNARVCLSMLRVDEPLVAEVQRLAAGGGPLANVVRRYRSALVEIPVDCQSPAQLGGDLGAVALDADLGTAHVIDDGDAAVLVGVTKRDAPPLRSVRKAVLQVAAETQGPALFNAWAADLLRGAEVEVDASIGRWGPAKGTGDLPTVLPN